MISCGGGGGGAAGASIPADKYTTHNPGGWSGGGSSGTSGGNSNSGENTEVTIQGSTPLIVSGYTFNGRTYPDLTSLTLAMSAANATGSFTVPFTVSGDSAPRTARVTKTGEGYSVEHQYKATYYVTVPNGVDATELYYYANDGFDISADTGSNVDGWRDSNGGYHSGGIIRGVKGDITLTQVLQGTIPEVYLDLISAPDTAIQYTPPNGQSVYKLRSLTGNFIVQAKPASDSFPANSKYVWSLRKVGGNTVPPFETTTDTLTIDLSSAEITALGISGINDLSTNPSNPDQILVTCTVKHDNLPDSEAKTSPEKIVKICKQIVVTSFTGSAADFLTAEFVQGNDASSPYTITITSATSDELKSIAKALGKSTDPNYKGGVYVNLDLSNCGATEIPQSAFWADDSYGGAGLATYLTGITLPNTLRRINHLAFNDCSALSGTLTIPATVEYFGYQCFDDTNISGLTYDDTTSIWEKYDWNNSLMASPAPTTCPTISLINGLSQGQTYWRKRQ